MTNRNQGFTLFELLMTVLLVALIMGVALPTFSATVARQHQRVEIDALFHAIHRARKESIMRRKVVSLCPSTDGHDCAPGDDWSRGWILFENADRDSPPRVDPGEPVLVSHRVSERVRITANRRAFTLRATFLRATNGTLVFCDENAEIMPRALIVSYTGRPRVASHTADREPYSCAD
ncbi:MAG TPA: GspH/FimT family pseudopilin [Woeseiaceae bacterium]|nr:GspH/FimT family pseudopilin [Woeseiaceae bacterium]